VSHSADPASRRADGGFTVVEILVAIGVLTTVMVALLPQLVVGMRSTGTARLVTQAKGVAQGELEKMRALPFYVASGAAGVDVLDTYYPRRTETSPAPTCATGGRLNEPQAGWSGYVSPTATRCSYEPTGAFYRSVRPVVTAPNLGRLVIVTATRFLSAGLPPQTIVPPVGYDSQVADKDVPPSRLIGVTVTVLRPDHGTLRPITAYTQIHERGASPQRARVEATVKVVEVGSVTADAGALSFTAGQVDLRGAMSNAVTTNANLAATSASLASGVQGSGATSTVLAPPTAGIAASTRPAGMLTVGGCSYACWGATYLGPTSVTVEDGLPRAGTTTAPLQAMINDVSANSGFTVGNTAAGGYSAALDLTGPLVRLDATAVPLPSGIAGCAPGAGGIPSYVTASGYLLTTSGGDLTTPYRSESCAVARTTAVSVLPTSFAPLGVLRIELTRASARCRVDGSGHVATTAHDFLAVVQYWNGAIYVPAAIIVPGASSDPLAAVPLTTPVGGGHVLGDYIASWSSLTKDKVTNSAATGAAKVTLPGVVTIATQPVRASSGSVDPSSGVSVTIGAVGCLAEDAR